MQSLLFFFFFNDTATTEIYTLSLHDALPICDFSKMALAYTSSQCANNESCKVVQERILLKWTSQLRPRRWAAKRIKARFGSVPSSCSSNAVRGGRWI